jgi:hypothetical protein
MRKKTLVRLYILANALFAAALIDVVVANILDASVLSHCTASTCTPLYLLKMPPFLIASIILVGCYGCSFIVGGIVVIATLIKEAQYQRWVWFFCTLFLGFFPIFGDIYLLVYLLAVPEAPQFSARTDEQGYQRFPPYPPYPPIPPHELPPQQEQELP